MKVDVKDNKSESTAKQTERRASAPVRFLHYIFIHNIGYKLLAVVLSAAVWLLSVGL